jgi:type IV pilus assembly protein PilC
MAYSYSVYTDDKKIVHGTIEAASEKTAEEALNQAGYHHILTIKEKNRGISFKKFLPSFSLISSQHIIDFTYQLAALVKAGVPIMSSLYLLEEQAPNNTLRKIVAGLADQLRDGYPLSQALARYPRTFSTTYCQMIKASEATGNLELALKRMAEYLEKEQASQKKAGRALIYPALVILMAIGAFSVLTIMVLPTLAKLFNSLGAELPAITRTLLATSSFFSHYGFLVVGVLVGLIILAYFLYRLPFGKEFFDTFVLKVPMFGRIVIQRNLGRFCLTSSMLLSAGLSVPIILDVATNTLNNTFVRRKLGEVRRSLLQGQSLSQSMEKNTVFPHLLVEMASVGEATGTLDSTFASLGEYYERRVEQLTHVLISMIEPALIFVVGAVVAFLALSMVTPLFSLYKNIH